jgi:hypothetical protein
MLLDRGANVDLRHKVRQRLMLCTNAANGLSRARDSIVIVLLL